MKKFIVSTVLLICFSCVANAQEIEDIKKCSLINDPMKRLACFDALVKDESESPKDEVKPVVAEAKPKEKKVVVEEGVSKSSEEILEGVRTNALDINKLLEALDNEDNESIMGLTSRKIKSDKNDILQRLQIKGEDLKIFHKKLHLLWEYGSTIIKMFHRKNPGEFRNAVKHIFFM